MMKKFTTYLFICALWGFFSSCDDDEVSAPPRPSFDVDKNSGLSEQTEFTFIVDEVNADAIAILPYGQEETGLGGILINKASFKDGKATVTFKYFEVGTFEAVVVASNYSKDGESVERSYSEATTITITSDKTEITAFSFEGSTKTEIDQDAKTIVVTMPYANADGVPTDNTSLKAKFTAAPFSTVKVGSTVQTSEETVNDFSSPVVYTVVSHDGTEADYTVTVNVTPIETDNTVKTFKGKSISSASKDKAYPGAVDNSTRELVIYAPYGSDGDFDSVRVAYELNGKFAKMQYGADNEDLKQDSLLNLETSKEVKVKAQDAATATYDVYATVAPKLNLSLTGLNPVVNGSNTDFQIDLTVLKGTDVADLETDYSVDEPAGVNVLDVQVNGVSFVSGSDLDYTAPVTFDVIVQDNNIGVTYVVRYKAVVTVIP